MRGLLLFLSIFLAVFTHAQDIRIRGQVKDSRGRSVDDATVTLYSAKLKDTLKTTSNNNGIFVFNNVPAGKITVGVSHISFSSLSRQYDFAGLTNEQSITDIVLTEAGKTLETVVVTAPAIIIKEDTVAYKVDSTMYKKNDKVEDVLKRLPGVEVDSKTGAVKAQGQDVTKVKVNGKEFFGGDVTTATKNLDADMVDRIDVIDDYGDQANFTGVRTGEATKTMNIQLKKDRNQGWFGNASVGAGTNERYANNATVNYFKNERQISFIGNLNNTNSSNNFSFGNVSGPVGGMVRSFTSMLGSTLSGGGITTTKSGGINYRDQWSKKVSAYGNYSYSNTKRFSESDVARQNFFADTILNNQLNDDVTRNNTHRVNFNVEYRIDDNNFLKFSPNVSISNSQSESNSTYDFYRNSQLRNDGLALNSTNSKTPGLNGNLLFNHKFKKKGRVMSFNLSGSKNGTDSDDDYFNHGKYYFGTLAYDSVLNQNITQNNNNFNYSLNGSYIEPLSKTKSLEFNYTHSRQSTDVEKEYFLIQSSGKTMVDSMSNIYNNDYYTDRIGANFRENQKKYNYSVGMSVQPASIISNSVSTGINYRQNIVNYYPNIRFTYNFSRSRSFSINYDGSTRQPSFTQLQPVTDRSNPLYVTVGNPDLRPEFSNTLRMRFNNFDFVTGNVFFGMLQLSMTNDKIVSNTIQQAFGAQETRYLNADGYYNGFLMYSYTKPILNRRYVFTYGGSLMLNNNLSYINNNKNTGRIVNLGQRFNTTITPKKWLETVFGVSYALNTTKNKLLTNLNAQNTVWIFSHNSRFDLPKNWIFTYSLDKSLNRGNTLGLAENPLIINSGIEKLISKKYNASLKLNGYDLLNENVFVNRSYGNNSITDSRVNRLGRYGMLSLVFRFSKYVGQAPRQNVMMGG